MGRETSKNKIVTIEEEQLDREEKKEERKSRYLKTQVTKLRVTKSLNLSLKRLGNYKLSLSISRYKKTLSEIQEDIEEVLSSR